MSPVCVECPANGSEQFPFGGRVTSQPRGTAPSLYPPGATPVVSMGLMLDMSSCFPPSVATALSSALVQRFECVANTPEETGLVELELTDESIIAERPSGMPTELSAEIS